MALANENYKDIYSGDASTLVFPYTFKILDEDEIEVIKYEVATGIETVLTAGYTVDGVGVDAGGNITLAAVLTTAYNLILRRKVPYLQPADWEQNGSFSTAVLEAELDRQVMMVLQLKEILDRSVLQSAINENPLILPVPLASKSIGWDPTGTFLINDPADFAATVAAVTVLVAAATAAKNAAVTAQGLAEVAKAAADADVILTAADAVQTALDVIATAADAVQTALDRIATGADAVQTALDVISTGADATQTGLDAIATAADRVQTGLDVIATAADAVQTALDVISTGADAIQTAADRVQTGLDAVATGADAIATAADRVQTGLDAIATAADRVQTGLDVIATAADRVQTALDVIATAADRVQTGLDAVDTGADAIATAADRVQTGLDAAATAADVISAGNITAGLKSTSTSSLAIGGGSKTFVTQAGKQFVSGMYVIAASDDDPTYYMHGYVTSYTSTSLVVYVTDVGMSGTKADWTISVSGTRGSTGPAGTLPIAVAAGTVDAITADYTPDVTLADLTMVAFVASGANTSATPTFAPDGLTAHTITKQGGAALLAGDIPAAGFVAIVEYNLASTRWELLNPSCKPYVDAGLSAKVTGSYASVAEIIAGSESAKVIAPSTLKSAINVHGDWGWWGVKTNRLIMPHAADNTRVCVNPDALSIPIVIGDHSHIMTAVVDVDEVDDLDTGTLAAGTDYCIYACTDGTTLSFKVSANATVPSGFDAAHSRKIGGFHTLCVAVGTISGHSLTDFAVKDILPASIWDLHHRPVCSPNGMVYSEGINKWVDIYLASGTGASTVSVYGGTISDTRNWMDFADDGGAVKKKMLDDAEFQVIAAGSNEETNITGSSDPGTTGGHVDTASRRMISNIGVEDACGALSQWLSTQSYIYTSTTGYWGNLPGGKGSYYTNYTSDPGASEMDNADAGSDVKLVAGGYWASGVNAGSRSRAADGYRWHSHSTLGCRFCAEPI